MRVYCISGVGADHRAFQRLNIPDHELIAVPWIEPLSNESLSSYANRLGASIDTKEPFALLGLSFGGMLAAEMAALLKPRKLILISSIASSSQELR